MAVNEGNIHYVEFRGDTAQLRKEIDLLSSKLNELSRATSIQTASVAGNTKNMASSMSFSFGTITRALAGAGIVIGIQQIGVALKEMIGATAEMETVRTTFRVFTGSVETADQVLSQLKKSALESPLNFQDFVQGARTLMGYGVTADQVTGIVKQLGDISGGSADRFQRLSLAFGQVVGAGRLMGQEARQMINAGFNPLQFIAEKTGKSMAQLSTEMKNGQISVQDVADAFKTATSEGGRFYGLSQEITNTLGGQFNKLKESLFFLGAELGAEFVKSFNIKGAIEDFGKAIELIKPSLINLFQTIGNSQLFETFSKLVGLLPPILELLTQIAGTLFAIVDYFAELIVSGVDSFFGIFKIKTSDANDELERMNDNVKKLIPEVNTLTNNELIKKVFDIESLKNNQSDAYRIMQQGKIDMTNFTNGIKKENEKAKEEIATPFNTTPPGEKDAKDILEKNVRTLVAKLRNASKEVNDAIDEINKPFIEAYKSIGKYITGIYTEIEKYSVKKNLGQRGLDIFNLAENFNKQITLAKMYGYSTIDITHAYESQVNLISTKYRDENFKNAKDHADRMIGVVQKQAQAQSDIMMKLSGVSGKVNLDQLVDNTILTRFETFTSSLYATVNDFAQQTPALFGQALGEMLVDSVSFSDAIDNLGSIMLGAFGKLLQQLGSALITLGVSSEAFQKAIEKMFIPGNPGSGVAAIVAGTALVAAGAAFSKLASASGASKSSGSKVAGSLQRTMASGQTYQYGGANYSMQSIKLSIDLTGSITASPTGYNISKQYETIARVTGR